MSTLPGRLMFARTMRGLSQSEVAQKTGLHVTAISHFECGRRVPSIPNLIRLCKALNTSANWVLGLEEK